MAERDGFKNLRKTYRIEGMSEGEIERYVERWGERGAHRRINYYRAMMRSAALGKLPPFRRIDAPVLVIWGRGSLHEQRHGAAGSGVGAQRAPRARPRGEPHGAARRARAA